MGVIGDAPLNGIYSLAQYGRNYPVVMDLTYPLSIRSGTDFVMSGIEIGSIIVVADEIFVSWYNHNTSTYGVDKLDWDNKLNGAYLETNLVPVYRNAFANYTKFLVAYTSLPAGADIEIEYSKDYGTNYVATTEKIDTDRKIVYAEEGVEATLVQMKIKATVSANDAPVIESSGIFVS